MDGNQEDKDRASRGKGRSHTEHLNSELLKSVYNGDVSEVEKSLKEGADINTRGRVPNLHDYLKKTPLFLAVLRNNLEICKALLRVPNIDVNEGEEFGFTPLHEAARQGLVEIVEVLLESKDIDVNAVYTKTGDRPLHFAACSNREEVAEKLLNVKGILVNGKNSHARTALHECASKGQFEVTTLLLSVPGILVNEKDDFHSHTPLHLAADFGHLDVLEALLSHPDIDVNVKDKYGQTALHTTACNGNLKAVEMLLNAGINVQEKTNNGFTAHYWATKRGHTNVAQMIVNHLKRSDIPEGNACAAKKVYDITQAINRIKMPQIDHDTILNELNTQLLAAAKNGDLNQVEELLKYPDIDVNSKDQYLNNTPLHLASEKGHIEVVRALLKVPNIEVNAKKKDVSKLAYPVYPGDNPMRGKLQIGKTALHLAVANGHLEVVKELLSCSKIDVNAKDKYDEFPLYEAVHSNNIEIAELLLSHPNIDVNAINTCNEHFTLLHVAVEKANLRMTKVLLNHPNININLRDKFYRCTPLELAQKKNWKEIAEYISSYQKRTVNTKGNF